MAYNTTTSQGSFVSTGQAQFIPFPSGVDWIEVRNLTTLGSSANPSAGMEWYWQRPAVNTTIVYFNTAGAQAVNAAQLAAPNSIYYMDTTNPAQFAPVAVTAGTNAVRPVLSTASTAGLTTGSIVRLTNLATAPNLNGYDFSIDTVVANTSFRIANALANAPGAITGAGFWRLISTNPIIPGLSYWYPQRRNIVNITQAFPAVITTSVDSQYVAGQSIRLSVPAQFGMTQADGLLVNVISVAAGGLVTVNLDSTGFSAFTFPLVAAYPFTPAQTIPVGEETDEFANPNLLDDATINTGQTGLVLPAGLLNPAGTVGDLIEWIGGKTFNGS
jgi:hypothetical protein